MKISGNTFIVTGGLGGLGSDAARMLLEKGANVAVFDVLPQEKGEERLRASSLAATAAGASSPAHHNAPVVYVATDITDKAASAQAVQRVIDTFGGLHGLIHCAGVALRRDWADNNLSDSVDLFRKTIEINAVGTMCINAAVGDAINRLTVAQTGVKPKEGSRFWSVDEERGVIVNFASIAGHEPNARIVGYGPSKTCVLGLTKSIADFYAPSGIRVNSVSPGVVATPMNASALGWFEGDLSANGTFPKRPCNAHHVSQAVQALIENEFINAEDIKVTGGWRLATTWLPGAGDPRDAAPGLE
ncbi:unnamed protein product [Parajaminaea phylloscopi]